MMNAVSLIRPGTASILNHSAGTAERVDHVGAGGLISRIGSPTGTTMRLSAASWRGRRRRSGALAGFTSSGLSMFEITSNPPLSG